MIRRPPRSTRTDTLFPYTTLFRSILLVEVGKGGGVPARIINVANAVPLPDGIDKLGIGLLGDFALRLPISVDIRLAEIRLACGAGEEPEIVLFLRVRHPLKLGAQLGQFTGEGQDRKRTRLNSSH